MQGAPGHAAPRGGNLLAVMAVSAAAVAAAGGFLVLSWARQSRLEGELSRARALLDEARVRLGGAPLPAPASGGDAAPAPALEEERAEAARLEEERAELRRRAEGQSLEIASLERRVARLNEEVALLRRKRPPAGTERAADEGIGRELLDEHARARALAEEARATRDRLKRMVEALEDVVRERADRADPGAEGRP